MNKIIPLLSSIYKTTFLTMLNLSIARPYLGSNVFRVPVPSDKLPWHTYFPEYSPIDYTASKVLAGPSWADPADPNACKFNQYDGAFGVNRISYEGFYNLSSDGRPLNPKGRMGISGRGLLGRWGVNHAADPIISRLYQGKLHLLLIKRRDTGKWAIPGGMVDARESVDRTLEREFCEEALGGNRSQKLEEAGFWRNAGKDVYKGYVDDHRNTDNAWIETTAINFHDNSNLFDDIKIQAGDDAADVQWIDISTKFDLYDAHVNFIRKVADLHGVQFSP